MKRRIEQLMRECGEASDQMAALIEVGRSVPTAELEKILRRANRLHNEIQAEMRLMAEAS